MTKALVFVAAALVAVQTVMTMQGLLSWWSLLGTVIVLSVIGAPLYIMDRRSKARG